MKLADGLRKRLVKVVDEAGLGADVVIAAAGRLWLEDVVRAIRAGGGTG